MYLIHQTPSAHTSYNDRNYIIECDNVRASEQASVMWSEYNKTFGLHIAMESVFEFDRKQIYPHCGKFNKFAYDMEIISRMANNTKLNS